MGQKNLKREFKEKMPVTSQPSGEWKSSLILGSVCTDPWLCVKGYCCPCVGLGSIARQRGDSCIIWALYFLLPPLNCICHYKLRRDIRDDHGISGGCLCDMCIVSFCSCCAIIQEDKQVNSGI